MSTVMMVISLVLMAACVAVSLQRGAFQGVKLAFESSKPGLFLRRKSEGLSTLVVIIVLIVICVGLCIIFKDQLKTFFTSIFSKLDTKTDALWD